jgi:hypothetical protein
MLPDSCPLAYAFQARPLDQQADEPVMLSKEQWLILEILAESQMLMKQPDIRAATAEAGHELSERTIGPILSGFLDAGWVTYPNKKRMGAVISKEGRVLLDKRKAAASA